MSAMWSNRDRRPLTIADLEATAEQLRPIGQEIVRAHRSAFLTVALYAAEHGLTWREAVSKILDNAAPDERPELDEFLEAARRAF